MHVRPRHAIRCSVALAALLLVATTGCLTVGAPTALLEGARAFDVNEDGLVVARRKQGSGVPGVFLAGDADGDAQFAIVAAAEGAVAATVIHQELLNEDEVGLDD